MKHCGILALLLTFLLSANCHQPIPEFKTGVLVIGGGTGGVCAGLQSSRLGVPTIIVEPTPWLGGMLTAAGVSATDGNHQLPAGLWGAFRDRLRKHYGSADALFTGWVSNTMFEPKVGAKIFQSMAEAESNLSLHLNSQWKSIEKDSSGWKVALEKDGKPIIIHAKILIDGTDLGDVAAAAGAGFDVGMEAAGECGESMAPATGNDILQDLTYVAILQDYGPKADKTIPQPEHYRPENFYCSCQQNCDDPKAHSCEKMLEYGKLPNGKYMINWPIHGNDYYLNVLEMGPEERKEAYAKAKNHTLGFVYYIQQELGFKNLGLAENEFPSADGLALIPYHREGRRMKGLARFNVNHILHPYATTLYRTGVAVGDYPIDHHHDKNPDAPEIEFPAVPSFSIPGGALLPQNVDNLIVADKAISISNIANGSTRLQPVIMQVGQAAGALAALAVKQERSPSEVSIRLWQQAMLDARGYLLPFIDVAPDDPHFAAIQRIGATGIFTGKRCAIQMGQSNLV